MKINFLRKILPIISLEYIAILYDNTFKMLIKTLKVYLNQLFII